VAVVQGPGVSGGAVVVMDAVTAPPAAASGALNVIAERAWRLVQATGLVGADPESDRLLEGLIRGLLDPALPLSLAAHGDDEAGAWERYTNPQHARIEDLPYAVQWTGATVAPRLENEPADTYLQRARLEARRPRGMFRGSERALIDVAQPFLTGTHAPRITPDAGGDLDTVLFVIHSAGVTDAVRLEAALNDPAVIAAGMRVLLVLSDTLVWDEATVGWDATTDAWDTFNG
jgi:hypothetical protein